MDALPEPQGQPETQMSKPKRGRPVGYRSPDPKNSYIRIRCRAEDKARWQDLAKTAGKTLTDWLTDRLP